MRIYKISGVALIAIFLFGCNSNSSIVEKAKLTLSTVLKDPVSAQYRNIYIEKIPKKIAETRVPPVNWIVCGEVNSKNSFGAYTGFKKFRVNENAKIPLYEDVMESQWEKSAFKLLYEGCMTSSYSERFE